MSYNMCGVRVFSLHCLQGGSINYHPILIIMQEGQFLHEACVVLVIITFV